MLRKVRKKNELSGACLLLLVRLFMSKNWTQTANFWTQAVLE